MGEVLLYRPRRRAPAAPTRRPFSWGLVLAFLIPVSAAIAVAAALAGCAENPTAIHRGAPSSESYPQVQDQCDAQPWLAWCVADAEKRHT